MGFQVNAETKMLPHFGEEQLQGTSFADQFPLPGLTFVLREVSAAGFGGFAKLQLPSTGGPPGCITCLNGQLAEPRARVRADVTVDGQDLMTCFSSSR